MLYSQYVAGFVAALIVSVLGLLAIPGVFAQRVMPGIYLGQTSVSGISDQDLPSVIRAYERELVAQEVTLALRDSTKTHTLGELGVALDVPATAAAVKTASKRHIVPVQSRVVPVLSIDEPKLQRAITQTFGKAINAPRDATLVLGAGTTLTLRPGVPGEGVDVEILKNELQDRAVRQNWQETLELVVATHAPVVENHETTLAKQFAQELLRDGVTFQFEDQTWVMRAFTIRRLLRFTAVPDPKNPSNYILGAHFDDKELRGYLTTTIVPEINQPAQNARFERTESGTIEQFASPRDGREVDIEQTVTRVAERIASAEKKVDLAVAVAVPAVSTTTDIEALGVHELLATGHSDFVGSPANRVHNITVGTSRYHGLLIPPGEEFSFNEFLGPVDGEHGFKPELVIKQNVTIPEFGGGLCQVSTTLFRAAVYSGLEVTARRNHAYPVRYYGTPGFDATIYPPYTDLRFTNNTPGYILIQAKLVGSELLFEFWGTKDGREVEIVGPTIYDRQSNGALKATLKQTVHKEGSVMLETTFHSRYKSPDLFPKVIQANDPRAAEVPPPSPAPGT